MAELMWWADFFDTHVSAPEMTVDGRPPRDSFSYRATSPLVEMSWVEDSVLGIDSDL